MNGSKSPHNLPKYDPIYEVCSECFPRHCELSKQLDSTILHKRISLIYLLESDTITNILRIGELWAEINDKELWRSCGNDEVTSFRSFCTKECMRSASTVYNYIGIYRKFSGVADGISVDHTRLIKALPYVSTKEEAQEWVHRASTLNTVDYDNFIRESKGKVPSDDGEHEHIWEDYKRCTICGKWEKR